MGKKAVKSARKFANSGQLKATIQARRKHQDIRRKQQGKQQRKGGKGRQGIEHEDEDGGEDEDVEPTPASKKGKSK
jgi:nucleolar complex protein 2